MRSVGASFSGKPSNIRIAALMFEMVKKFRSLPLGMVVVANSARAIASAFSILASNFASLYDPVVMPASSRIFVRRMDSVMSAVLRIAMHAVGRHPVYSF